MAKKKPAGPRNVQCYHCGHQFDVSARAMTGSCPSCYGKLMLDDVVVKNTQSYRTLQTCGRLLIEPKGRVIADFVHACEGVEVLGKLETKGFAGGHVVIRRKALWRGDCNATSLTIEEGAVVHWGQFDVPIEAEDTGDVVTETPDRAAPPEPQQKPAPTDANGRPMKTSSTRNIRPPAQTTPIAAAPSSSRRVTKKTASKKVAMKAATAKRITKKKTKKKVAKKVVKKVVKKTAKKATSRTSKKK